MIVKRKLLIPACAVFIATAGVAGSVYAGASCPHHAEIDVWQLELVEVTSDGQAVEDLDEYDSFEYHVESHPFDRIRFVGQHVDSDGHYLLELIPKNLLPENLRDDEEQGGE